MAIFPPSSADSPSPWKAGLPVWRKVLGSTYRESNKDSIGLVGAGVAYYGFLAFVPILAATVLLFGMVADPAWIAEQAKRISQSLPKDAAGVINDQLVSIVKTSSTKKGFGLVAAFLVALFGARNGAGSIITALNIAYGERETRGFLRLNLLAIGITLGAMVAGLVAMAAITAIGTLEQLVPFASGAMIFAGRLLSLLVFALVAAAGAATLYRYAPDRPKVGWVWITPGSVFFALAWLLLTYLFGLYVQNFGSYNVTYGSIGAIVVFITWLYLSSYALLLGAELNAEFEQHADETTRQQEPERQPAAPPRSDKL